MRKSLPDILKGLAVLFMIQVHLMELFMKEEVFVSGLGKLSLFLGGPPAAPVFMAVMGYFLARPSVKPLSLLVRGLKLLLWGLLLNLGLNLHLLYRYFFKELEINPFHYLFGVDILFLAGFSLMVIAGTRYLFRDRLLAYGLLAIVAAGLGDHLPALPHLPGWQQYLLALAGGHYGWSYFPLFPWLAYPLTGYAFYLAERQYFARLKLGKRELYLGLGLLAIVLFSLPYGIRIAHDLPAYYHHGLLYYSWTLAFLACYTWFARVLGQRYGEKPLLRYVQWLGQHVTVIYVFQWLIIGNLATALYKTQASWSLLPWFALVLAAASGFGWLYVNRRGSGNVLQ